MTDFAALPTVVHHPKTRRSAAIAHQLRELIYSGTLKPGDRLPTEDQLCRHFGVSRTTLRESVQMLRVSGLLDVTPGRGSFIRLPDTNLILQDLALLGRYNAMDDDELRELRALLETDLVQHACMATGDAKKQLHSCIIARDAAPSENATTEHEWHMTIARLSGNTVTATMLEALLKICHHGRTMALSSADEVVRTMGVQIRLNMVIMDGDKPQAARIMASYLRAGMPVGAKAAA